MGQKKLQIEMQQEYRNKENIQTLQKNMEWSNIYVKEEREWIRGDIWRENDCSFPEIGKYNETQI